MKTALELALKPSKPLTLLARWLSSFIAALSLMACSTTQIAPTHSALLAADAAGTLAPLIPARRFVVQIDGQGGFVLSPNTERLLWQKAVGADTGLAVRSTASGPSGEMKTFATGNQGRAGGFYTWLADNRHFVYSKDPTGNENTQLWVQDADAPFAPWAVSANSAVRSEYVGRSGTGSAHFYFLNNARNPAEFDLYEANVKERTIREHARNDGKTLRWVLGQDNRLAARVRRLGSNDGADVLTEWLDAQGQWHALKTVGGFDTYWLYRINIRSNTAWVLSNVGRDKAALIAVNLRTNVETILGEHPQVDVGTVTFGTDSQPIAYTVEPDLPRNVFFDATLQSTLDGFMSKALQQGLIPEKPVAVRFQTIHAKRVLLRATSAFDQAELLIDVNADTVERLNPRSEEAKKLLSPIEPYAFQAKDGLTIHGYLIRPKGVAGPVPLIINIHGGPMARDSWANAQFETKQMLANRGYAVLQVNYRGSSGYGNNHMWAGAHEYSGLLQQDIAQAAQWAIDQGIADPKRMAVMGGSFGGFSVLMQLIQKPHDYRCGIDIVGVANWPRTIESWPVFWKARHYFDRFYGDVTKPEERATMLARSPISQLDKITAPLLVVHGGNDVRVLRQDSDDVVQAMRGMGKKVDYLLFDDEGHSIVKWQNRLKLNRTIEDYLAQCLGGRSAGFDAYELAPK